MTPDTSSPPALPRPTASPARSHRDLADQEPEDHAEREGQKVSGRARPGDAAEELRGFVDGGFQPATYITSIRCSVVSSPSGSGMPPRSIFSNCHLTGELLVAELLERFAHRLPRW